jgi:hypothetical protein
MSKYAADTSVSSESSRAEIERTLQKYGADQFMYGWDGERAVVGFRMEGRQIRFVLDMPDRNDPEFWFTPARRNRRSEAQAYSAWEQATRQRWRALALVIKAKLEAVESGITVFDDEFMAHILLPDGSTVSEFMRPQVEAAYATGQMPSMLPALEAGT